MRCIHIALPVVGLLLGGGAAMAATGTSAASPGTETTVQSPLSTTHARPGPNGGLAGRGTTATTSGKASITKGSTFADQGAAAKACGSAANVVWANPGTKVFHVQGDQYFGHTKRGAFMCKSTATAEGYHASGQAAHKG